MNHAMIDIETLGNRPGCVIASIGAVIFDPIAGTMLNGPANPFYVKINLESCTQAGLHLDVGTVLWWLGKSDAARSELTDSGGRMSLHEALGYLREFARRHAVKRVWSHGAPFDIPILTAAYDIIGEVTPWAFWDARDTRTIYELANIKVQRDPATHHNALEDAIAQASAVIEAYRVLRLAKGRAEVAP